MIRSFRFKARPLAPARLVALTLASALFCMACGSEPTSHPPASGGTGGSTPSDCSASGVAECLDAGAAGNDGAGSCPAGHVDIGGFCMPGCGLLDCGAQNRNCDESQSGPKCGACLEGWRAAGTDCVSDECADGYIQSGENCAPVRDCAGGCAQDQGCYPLSGECASCAFRPACDDPEGETGRVLILEPRPGAECVCETKPGYYVSAARNAQRCDADGDGWVVQAAQASIDGEDPVLALNARCDLQQIEHVVLENEAGAELVVELAARLPLYESAGNDGAGAALPHAPYGARHLPPAALNSLTKACVSEIEDFNDNGVADVGELPGSKLGADLGWNAKLRSYFERYAEFSYYLELFDGWHEPPSSGGVGLYRIVERPRDAAAGKGVAIHYGEGADPHFRQCRRHVDADFGRTPDQAAWDFAEFGEDWGTALPGGIGHTSQFKCMRAVSSQQYVEQFSREANPEVVFLNGPRLARRTAFGATEEYALKPNVCEAGEATSPGPGGTAFAQLTCSVRPIESLEPGVYWMAVDFEPYASPEFYRSGCIDECAERESAVPACYGCSPRAFGREDVQPLPAGKTCETGVCDGAGHCGDCVPASFRCRDASVLQVCTSARQWADSVVCTLCEEGVCYAECVPTERRCAAGIPQTCDAAGRWQPDPACDVGRECAGAGVCLLSDHEPCAAASECASGACTTFYEDFDLDGYGQEPQGLCGATPPAGYVADGSDCCDDDVRVYPGQSGFFTQPRNVCGGYDFDCSGSEERQYAGLGGWQCSGPFCNCWSGWATSVPACGVSGPYINCSSGATVTQACH